MSSAVGGADAAGAVVAFGSASGRCAPAGFAAAPPAQPDTAPMSAIPALTADKFRRNANPRSCHPLRGRVSDAEDRFYADFARNVRSVEAFWPFGPPTGA